MLWLALWLWRAAGALTPCLITASASMILPAVATGTARARRSWLGARGLTSKLQRLLQRPPFAASRLPGGLAAHAQPPW